MPIRKTVAHTPDGVGIDEITLTSGDASVAFLTVGAVTRDWRLHHEGQDIPVVLSYDDPQTYLQNPSYFGAIAGRLANRTANGRFEVDGVEYQCSQNEGANMLHGGPNGLVRRLWQAEVSSSSNSVKFTYHSVDGEEGFPGAVDFIIDVRLEGTTLTYEMKAISDRRTPINMAQHSYYNLMGAGTIWDHSLEVAARQFTPFDEANIPTGDFADVEGTRFDFRNSRRISDVDVKGDGLDQNLVLYSGKPAAILRAPNGLVLTLETDQPGLQVYTGTHLNNAHPGRNGREIEKFGGICLEPQTFPNAINQQGFETRFAEPDAPYRQVLKVDISKENT